MTAEAAAAIGGIRPEPASRELRLVAETDEEWRHAGQCQSAGHDGAAPPRS